jgi:hypothetical protein
VTRENFEQTLRLFTERRPFAPYVLELNGGERYEVDHPGGLAFGEGKGVFVGPGGILRIFDNESVLQIIDAPAHAIRPRKPKKS